MLIVGLLEEVGLPQAPQQDKSLPMQAGVNKQSSKASLHTHVPLQCSALLISSSKNNLPLCRLI